MKVLVIFNDLESPATCDRHKATPPPSANTSVFIALNWESAGARPFIADRFAACAQCVEDIRKSLDGSEMFLDTRKPAKP